MVLRQTQTTLAAEWDRRRGAQRALRSKGQSSGGLLCMTGGRRRINGSRNYRGLLALSDPATPGRGRGPGVRDGAPKTAADQRRGARGGGGPEGPPGRPAGQRGATSSHPPRGRAANDSAPTPPVRTGRTRT